VLRGGTKVIQVRFFGEVVGEEPVRRWFKKYLTKEQRKAVGKVIRNVEFDWPIGMPNCKKTRGEFMGSPSKVSRGHSARAVHRNGRQNGVVARFYKEVAENAGNASRTRQKKAANGKASASMALNEKYVGGDFSDFLREEGIYDEVTRNAEKMSLVHRLQIEMRKQRLTMTTVARRMKTSRSSLARILDPENKAVSIELLERAAEAIGRRIRYELV
jgi:antitoxin HicB